MTQKQINLTGELWEKFSQLYDETGYQMSEKNFWKAMEEYDKSFPIEPPVSFAEAESSFGQWIDVKNQPPPFEEGILATDGKNIICCEIMESKPGIYLVGHNFSGYEWEWDEIYYYNSITKWMPLPKP